MSITKRPFVTKDWLFIDKTRLLVTKGSVLNDKMPVFVTKGAVLVYKARSFVTKGEVLHDKTPVFVRKGRVPAQPGVDRACEALLRGRRTSCSGFRRPSIGT